MKLDLGQPIGYGRTAEIYAWQEGQVLKLFYSWFPLENIEREEFIAQAISQSGLPVPAVGDIVCVNDRFGLVYERIYGEPMWRAIRRKPWRAIRYARYCAELQNELHTLAIPIALPRQREILIGRISQSQFIPEPIRCRALAELASMPDEDCLCHGDFWPGNILLTTQGAIIIDWLHASRGNPQADVARTVTLGLGGAETRQITRPFLSLGSAKIEQVINPFLQLFLHIALNEYLRRYFALRPGGADEYQRWLPIMAVERLSDNIPELENWLLNRIARAQWN